MHTVFCYGTLKRGGALHYNLSRQTGCIPARFRGEAQVPGLLYVSKTGWYPRMLPGNGIVHGELWEHIGDPLLARLDLIEGHPTLFERRRVKTTDGEEVWAYFYALPVAGLDVLPSGKFDVRQSYYER